MKANELRIGNYYNHNGETKKVTPSVIESLFESEDRIWCIPFLLTEEWHNKFGVKKNGFNVFEYQISDRQLISFNGDYVYLRDLYKKDASHNDDLCVIWNKDIKRRDMYVHEFQNIYFALKGDELIIKT